VSRRNYIVLGCWMLFLGVVGVIESGNRLNIIILTTTASPLWVLASYPHWKPKEAVPGPKEK